MVLGKKVGFRKTSMASLIANLASWQLGPAFTYLFLKLPHFAL
jgi:hypothetical protein